MEQAWNLKAFQSRISNSKKRERFPAGSPNAEEIQTYRSHIFDHFQGNLKGKQALVLGLTPELRSMLHYLGTSVICIDNNPDAIALFRDWLPKDIEVTENILEGSWSDLSNLLQSSVDIIVGDGVFGNMLSLDLHFKLLTEIKSVMNPQGICVFRKIMIPQNFSLDKHQADLLIEQYNQGVIDESEFGFGMRIFGLKEQVFDPETFLLDNRKSFDIFEKMYRNKILSTSAMSAIQRYYFNGLNLITPQSLWEELLKQVGFDFVSVPLQGKQWYEYYPIYRCSFI